MENWRKYIDSRFLGQNAKILTRDRIPVVCPICGKCTITYVSNLQLRVKTYGDYKCRSCAGKAGYLQSIKRV